MGDIVHIARSNEIWCKASWTQGSKVLDVLLKKKTPGSSFELVNTEDVSLIKRNVKHMRHESLAVDSPIPELEKESISSHVQSEKVQEEIAD